MIPEFPRRGENDWGGERERESERVGEGSCDIEATDKKDQEEIRMWEGMGEGAKPTQYIRSYTIYHCFQLCASWFQPCPENQWEQVSTGPDESNQTKCIMVHAVFPSLTPAHFECVVIKKHSTSADTYGGVYFCLGSGNGHPPKPPRNLFSGGLANPIKLRTLHPQGSAPRTPCTDFVRCALVCEPYGKPVSHTI